MKYGPLRERLAVAAQTGPRNVELTFAEIAELVGGLPSSALPHPAVVGEQRQPAGVSLARR